MITDDNTNTLTARLNKKDFLVILGGLLLHAVALVFLIRWAKGFKP